MVTCPNCEANLPDGALHCGYCGRALTADTLKDEGGIAQLRAMVEARVSQALPAVIQTAVGQPSQALAQAPQAPAPIQTAVGQPSQAFPQTPQAPAPIQTAVGQPSQAFPQAPASPGISPTLDRVSPPASSSALEPAEEALTSELRRTDSAPGEPSLLPLAEAPRRAETGAARARVAAKTAEPKPAELKKPEPPQAVFPIPGEVVDGYRIEAEVGRGGMGRVYRATHEVTGQTVALKMLLPELVLEPRQKARFINEAKLLARLEHPNLVPLLGFVDDGRRAFIVMPFVHGRTLDERVAEAGRLPLPEAQGYFEQLCAGLTHVHTQGILHRDLKPSNVILKEDGGLRVTDFGVARAIGTEKLTRTGMVVGTAEYLSPEQANGTGGDDPRCDVYALGIMLYEMLTGQVPFRHPNPAQVLMKHVSAPPPPPRAVVPTLPEALEKVVLKALEKLPDQRYASIEAFKEAALPAFKAPAGDPSRPPSLRSVAPVVVQEPVQPALPSTPPRPAPPAKAPPAPSDEGLGRLFGQILLGITLGSSLAAAAWWLLDR